MKQNKNYDERQTLERGKAFRNAYLTLTAAVLICFFLRDTGVHWADDSSQTIVCLWSSIVVCTVQLIVKDAYDGIHEGNMRIAAVIFLVCGVFMLGGEIVRASGTRFSLYEQIGVISSGLGTSTIGIVYWVKFFRDRNREQRQA